MKFQKPFKQVAISGGFLTAAAIVAMFMAPFEGEKFISYRDGGNIWTICRGHAKGVHEGMTANAEQCDAWYREDINEAAAVYDKYVIRDQHPNTEAAVISFIYNVGHGRKGVKDGFAVLKNGRPSTLLKKLNAGDRAGACAQITHWRNMSGKNCEIKSNNCYGLIVRRKAEKELCLDENTYNSYSVNADNIFRGVQGP